MGQSTTQEYTISAARLVISLANRSWMIHMQKELRIVLNGGVECKWKSHNTQFRAELHTRAIFVKDVNTVIVKARTG
jgi:predicted GNAT family acetyltransferase